MAIKISNADIQPALIYDNWFLDKLILEQVSETDNTAMPNYDLIVNYRLFAVDAENKRHFKNKLYTLTIKNYVGVAMEKAATGDLDLIAAMQAIENALATIVEDQTDLGTASVI